MELRQDILTQQDLIINPSAQRVRRLVSLSRRSFRLKTGITIIEGPNALREALIFANSDILDIYIQEDKIDLHQEILRLALSKNCYIHPVSEAVINEFTEASQGIAATFRLSFFQNNKLPSADNNTLGLALPATQDPGNLGTIIRTADACGTQYVVVCKGSADPFSPKVIRSSAGSIFHLPVIFSPGLKNFQKNAQEEKITLVGTLVEGGKPLPDFILELPKNKKICWVFGNEARGLSEIERTYCNEFVSIPLKGKAESFNVASAAVITLYESSQKLS